MIATEHVKIGELVMDGDEIIGVCVKECEPGEKVEVRDDIDTIMEAMLRRAMN